MSIAERTWGRDGRLGVKLDIFDAYAARAVDELLRFLSEHRQDLITVARGRHVWGHFRYGDKNLLDWDDGQLHAARVEELADAIVYAARELYRADLAAARHTTPGQRLAQLLEAYGRPTRP